MSFGNGETYRPGSGPFYDVLRRRDPIPRLRSELAVAEPATVPSSHRRSSGEAKWDVYTWTPGDPFNADSEARNRPEPNGTRLVATPDDDLSTHNARNCDRFTVTVRSPSKYGELLTI